jgi:hypothetical protein
LDQKLQFTYPLTRLNPDPIRIRIRNPASRLCPAAAGGQQEQWVTPPGRCKSRQLSASSGGGGGEPAAAEQAGLPIKKTRPKKTQETHL